MWLLAKHAVRMYAVASVLFFLSYGESVCLAENNTVGSVATDVDGYRIVNGIVILPI